VTVFLSSIFTIERCNGVNG